MKKLLLTLVLLILASPAFGQFAGSQGTGVANILRDPALTSAGVQGKTFFANVSSTTVFDSINYDMSGYATLTMGWLVSACTACNFTIEIREKDPFVTGNDFTICKASAAITANGYYVFLVSPDNPASATSPGLTTICAMRPPRTIYFRATNVSGTATINANGVLQ